MPTVTNTVRRPDGTLAAGTVAIELVGTNGEPVVGYVSASNYAIVSSHTFAMRSGTWSVTLVANALINPSGTRWRLIETVDNRPSEARYLLVPDGAGPYVVEDILDEAPGTVASTALTSHAADTNAHGGGGAFQPYTDLREFGTVDLTGGTDMTTLLQTATSEILTDGGGSLFVPAGTLRVTGLVPFTSMTGKGVDLIGAGHGRTTFNMAGAEAKLAFGFPVVDGTVANTSTTTTIDAATGTFPTDAVGRNITVLVGGSKQIKVVATRPSNTQVTLTSALTAAPDASSAWAVSGPASRGGYTGHFSMTCNYVAKNPLYIGQGAAKLVEHVRVFEALEDGIVIESTQNSAFIGLDVTNCRRDNVVVKRSAKNIDIYGLTASTARVSNLHIYEGGLSHVTGSDTPEKIKLFGGILEEDDTAVGAYLATVLIDDGDLIELHGTTVSAGGTGTTQAAVRLRRTATNPMQLMIYGGQYSARNGIGIDAGGGTASQPIRVFISDGTFLRSSGSTQAFFQIRDDNVRIRVGTLQRGTGQVYFANHPEGTSTRTAGDVISVHSDRTLIKAADTARASTPPASMSNDPHLTAQAETNTDYEVKLHLFVDGASGGDFAFGLAVPTGATFLGGRTALNELDAAATGQPNFTSFTATDTVTAGTIGTGTKLAFEVTGLLRVGSTLGTVALKWSQGTSNTTATTLFANSYMALRKIS